MRRSFPRSKRFIVRKILGRGGMSVVYEAIDQRRDLLVALKMLQDVDPARLIQFKEEFRTVADLSHPNLVVLYELLEEEGQLYICMERVDGTDFVSQVREPHAPDAGAEHPTVVETDGSPTQARHPAANTERGRFCDVVDEQRLRDGLRQLVSAIAALHAHGVVHHDIKPSNVLMTKEGRVVLLDFGVVTRLGATSSERFMGTPAFAAPEQLAGESPTPASDWYALGVILYKALTGRLPFTGELAELRETKRHAPAPPVELHTDAVPDDLSQLCHALLAPSPRDRPGLEEIARAVGLELESTPSPASPAEVFVGRHRELERLREISSRAPRERPVIVLEGASGMGKSALVRRFLDELRDEHSDLGVAHGRCHAGETLAYAGFDRIADGLHDDLAQLDPSDRDELLPEEAWRLARIFPIFADIVPEPSEGPDERPKEAGAVARRRAFETFRRLLERLSSRRPLVVWIDDLQWADRETIDLLHVVAEDLTQAGDITFILSKRPDASNIDEALSTWLARLGSERVWRHELGPLEPLAQSELRSRLGLQSPAASTAWNSCNGVPLLLAELARLYRSREFDAFETSSIRFDEVILQRLASHREEERRLLEVVAVAGEPTPASVLGKVAELEAANREQAVHALSAGRFLRITRSGPDPAIDVFHDGIREVLLPRVRRSPRIHRALARALADYSPAVGPERLARHWMLAEQPDLAGKLYEAAARRAGGQLAFDREAELWNSALKAGVDRGLARARLLEARATALAKAGRAFEAGESYLAAASEHDGDERAELERKAGVQLLRSGHPVRGLEALTKAFESMGVSLPKGRGRALVNLGLARTRLALRGLTWTPRSSVSTETRDFERLDLLFSASNYVGVIDHLAAASYQTDTLRLALDLGEPQRVARALAVEATYRAMQGYGTAPETLELLARATTIAEESGDLRLQGLVKLAEGGRNVFSLHLEAAAPACDEAEKMFRRVEASLEWEKVSCYSIGLVARIYLGQFDIASARVDRLLEEARLESDVYARNVLSSEPNVWRCLCADDIDAAWGSVERSITGWPPDRFWLAHYRHAVARMLPLLYAGRSSEALHFIVESSRKMKSAFLFNVPLIRGHVAIFLAAAAMLEGDRRRMSEAARHLRSTGFAAMETFASIVDLVASVRRGGSTKKVVDPLEKACDRLDETGHLLRLPGRALLGRLIGGTRGKALEREVEDELTTRGVRFAPRFIDMFVPRTLA